MSDHDDFENRLRSLLGEQVDHELGPRRPAPPMQRMDDVSSSAARRGHRRPMPWVMPLLAAACVAALVGGGIGVSQLVSDGSTPAATHGPTVDVSRTDQPTPSATPTTPSNTAPSSSSNTGPVAPPTTSHSTEHTAPPPAHTMAGFRGAQIAVPKGWTIDTNPANVIGGTDAHYFGSHPACLRPSNDSGSDPNTNCPILLANLVPPTGTPAPYYAGLDVDSLDWGEGNGPQYLCDEQNNERSSVQETAADSTFGGRAADFRKFVRSCGGTVRFEEIQYIVATPSAWGLLMSDQPSVSIFEKYLPAFETIAKYSVLPAATAGVRYMDRGIIRSVVKGQATVTIALDRVYLEEQDTTSVIVNQSPLTYDYTVPKSVWNAAKVHVGDRVYLVTDGSAVTGLNKETGA